MESIPNDLSLFIPAPALEYCRQLHRQHNFKLIITPPRRTRLGCFSVRPPMQPVIRMNNDLNPFNFLITYLHEVAHCKVYMTSKKRVAPHGVEWKSSFRDLLMPVLTPLVFPDDVLRLLSRHAMNPSAATGSDAQLYATLKKYDLTTDQKTSKIPLLHVKEGEDFVFQTRVFIKGSLRRTRVMCTEKSSSRRFTIPSHVLVEKTENS